MTCSTQTCTYAHTHSHSLRYTCTVLCYVHRDFRGSQTVQCLHSLMFTLAVTSLCSSTGPANVQTSEKVGRGAETVVTLPSQLEFSLQAVTAGEGWVAVATSSRNVRLFTVGGVQRSAFSLPGPVVCLAAHRQRLMAIYHAGMGKLGKKLNLPTSLLYNHSFTISSWIQYKIALICFHIVSGAAPPYLSELLHLYSPFLLLPSTHLGLAGGPWGRDPFNTSDLWSVIRFLFLSDIHLHFLLLSQNWKPISSLLHADVSFAFFSFYSTNLSPVMHVFAVYEWSIECIIMYL